MRPIHRLLMMFTLFALLASTGVARAADTDVEAELLRRVDEVRMALGDDVHRAAALGSDLRAIAARVSELESAFVEGVDPRAILGNLDRAGAALRRFETRREAVGTDVRKREGALLDLRARGVEIDSSAVVTAVDAILPRGERTMADLARIAARAEAVETSIAQLRARILAG